MPRSMPAGTSFPIFDIVVSDKNGPVDLTSAFAITVFTKKGGDAAKSKVATKASPQTGSNLGRLSADIAPADYPLADVGDHDMIVKVQWDSGGNDISYFGLDKLTITANPAL